MAQIGAKNNYKQKEKGKRQSYVVGGADRTWLSA